MEALRIAGIGVLLVFIVLSILAFVTWFVSKITVAILRRIKPIEETIAVDKEQEIAAIIGAIKAYEEVEG